jgi:bifunctional non-homologous end joining protein LigD
VVAFDLDPGKPATIIDCCVVALQLKKLFDQLNLESFPKTSGSKGLQVYLPLNSSTRYEATKEFARQVAAALEQQLPNLVVARMAKELRAGKVFIDWSQNDAHKTTVNVYSLRGKELPSVSTPVTWREVRAAAKTKKPAQLMFTPHDVIKRARKSGDLFLPVLSLKQRLPGGLASM